MTETVTLNLETYERMKEQTEELREQRDLYREQEADAQKKVRDLTSTNLKLRNEIDMLKGGDDDEISERVVHETAENTR